MLILNAIIKKNDSTLSIELDATTFLILPKAKPVSKDKIVLPLRIF